MPPLKDSSELHFVDSRTRNPVIVAALAIIIGLAVSGELVLKSVGFRPRRGLKWLGGMAILAEMGDRVAEYRIAEEIEFWPPSRRPGLRPICAPTSTGV